jgi:hypothetical protein
MSISVYQNVSIVIRVKEYREDERVRAAKTEL